MHWPTYFFLGLEEGKEVKKANQRNREESQVSEVKTRQPEDEVSDHSVMAEAHATDGE